MAYNYNANPNAKKSEAVEIALTLPAAPGTELQTRRAIYKREKLKWSNWKTTKTRRAKGADKSELSIKLRLYPFTFQKVEIRPFKSGK